MKQGVNDFLAEGFRSTRVGVSFYGAYRESTSIPNCEIDGYLQPTVSIDSPETNAESIGTLLAAMGSKLNAIVTSATVRTASAAW